jgi:hypothetical protein
MFIICLIKEHILPVISLGGIFFQVTLRIDSMFLAKTFPELISNYKGIWFLKRCTYSSSRTDQLEV